MSGLAAVVLNDDRPSYMSRCLSDISSRLKRRGPHGHGKQIVGRVGLAHFRLDDGSIDIDPTGPWCLRPGGPVLTGDLAIVNAAALCQATGVRKHTQATAILSAYDRWGIDAVERLEGEFAFVLWDPAKHLLLVVRDRFGVRPLAYRQTTDALFVASDFAALAEAGDVPSAEWIAAYLSGQEYDETLSPLQGIRRLAAGHMLVRQGSEEITIRRWWSLEPIDTAPSAGTDALAEALQSAVDLRMPTGAATFLSGGLDSSSLTCLAARSRSDPVHAYSMRYPAMAEMDEGEFINIIRELPNIESHDIFPRNGLALSNPAQMLAEQGAPVQAINLATMRQALEHIQGDGVRVIIDGHGGDEIIGHGLWHFETLARAGKWRSLFRLMRAYSAFTGGASAPTRMGAYMKAYGNRAFRIAGRLLSNEQLDDPFEWRDIVDRDLTRDTDLVARVRNSHAELHSDLPASMRAHAALIVHPGTATGFEVLDRTAASCGLVQRFPFYDRRVVGLCLGQPGHAKIAGGQSRALLRNAMQGILPDPLRLRPDKTDFADEVALAFRSDSTGQIAKLRNGLPEHLEGYVDPDGLARALEMLDDADQSRRSTSMLRLWRILWVDHWLRARETAGGTQITAIPCDGA